MAVAGKRRDMRHRAGRGRRAARTAIDRTNTRGGFAELLSLCSSPWLGDLEAEVVDLASLVLGAGVADARRREEGD